MPITLPDSMDECIYFTKRDMGSGEVTAWVRRKTCPKCKDQMGKPIKKNGKVDKKADHYACHKCGYTESNQEHEESLNLEVIYTCPHCGNEGETKLEYQRKKYKGVLSHVFSCKKCNKEIPITKKMKKIKKK